MGLTFSVQISELEKANVKHSEEVTVCCEELQSAQDAFTQREKVLTVEVQALEVKKFQ